jgi:hypothetical protein
MNGLRALGKGFAASLRSIQIVAWVYLVQLFIAAIIASAFSQALLLGIGNSMAFDGLLKDFDYTTYADFLRLHGEGVKAVFAQFGWGAAAALVLSTFLGGGIISALNSELRISFTRFLELSASYFWLMVRLLIISGIVTGGILFVCTVVLGFLFVALDATAESEKTIAINIIGATLLLALPVLLSMMVADYARVFVVVNGERKILRAYWRGMMTIVRNFFSAWLIQLVILAVILLSIISYWLLDDRIGMTSGGTIIAMFVIQQLFIGVRLWMRLWSQGSVLALAQIVSTGDEETKLADPEVGVTSVTAEQEEKKELTPSPPVTPVAIEKKRRERTRKRVAPKRPASKARVAAKRKSSSR